jgi:hypothetical protein
VFQQKCETTHVPNTNFKLPPHQTARLKDKQFKIPCKLSENSSKLTRDANQPLCTYRNLKKKGRQQFCIFHMVLILQGLFIAGNPWNSILASCLRNRRLTTRTMVRPHVAVRSSVACPTQTNFR